MNDIETSRGDQLHADSYRPDGMMEAELLPAGSLSDDEWEAYIREADPSIAIVERGKRIHAFSSSCKERHGKQGGSYFSLFMSERFGMAQSTASQWRQIGKSADELIDIINKFSPDWLGLYLFTTCDQDAKTKLLEHAEETGERLDQKLVQKAKNKQPFLGSQSPEYYTPKKYIDAVKGVYGGNIDLDPASCDEANTKYVGAGVFYTAKENGLELPWFGRVFCNPPYGGEAGPFVDRMVDAYAKDEIEAGILLLNGHSNGAGWFKPLWDHVLCFTFERIKFHQPGDEEGSQPTTNNIIIYIGKNEDRFASVFSNIGVVVKRLRTLPQEGPESPRIGHDSETFTRS